MTSPKGSPVLATSDIRSGNKHFENDFIFFHCLHPRADKGKIRSRQALFMLEQRLPNCMKEKLFLWIVFFPISCSSADTSWTSFALAFFAGRNRSLPHRRSEHSQILAEASLPSLQKTPCCGNRSSFCIGSSFAWSGNASHRPRLIHRRSLPKPSP
jgi:hypothetical protein